MFNQIGTIEQRREVLFLVSFDRKSISSRGFAQTTEESAKPTVARVNSRSYSRICRGYE